MIANLVKPKDSVKLIKYFSWFLFNVMSKLDVYIYYSGSAPIGDAHNFKIVQLMWYPRGSLLCDILKLKGSKEAFDMKSEAIEKSITLTANVIKDSSTSRGGSEHIEL